LKFESAKKTDEIQLNYSEKRVTPSLSVRGKFITKSHTSFEKGANGSVKTPGMFVLQKMEKLTQII